MRALQHRSVCLPVQVREYAWGSQLHELQMQPDVIIGADVVYQQEHFDALITSLWDLCAAHTVAFISYRLRGAFPACLPACLPAWSAVASVHSISGVQS